MAFHETQFPSAISMGSRGGPGFSTSIIEGDAGSSERVSRWANARRHYNVKPGIKTLSALGQTMDFYLARSGPAIGFRYKDWADFTTAADHRSAHSMTDVYLGTASGSSGNFQLRTQYVSGGTTVYRTISKPVNNSWLLARTPSGGGSAVQITANFTINPATGLAVITSGLTAGDSITGGCEFDVPAQFGAELDTNFDISIENFDWGDIPDIPIVEMVGDVTSPDRFYYGGASPIVSTTGLMSVNFGMGRVLLYNGSGAATWLLPDPTDLEPGGPYFMIHLLVAQSLTLKTFNNVDTIGSAAVAGKIMLLCVYPDSGVNKWSALIS